MDAPLEITAIMPCYNRAYDLRRVLEAYDAQDLRAPFEVIAVDDASSDATYAVLCAYQPQHYSLRVERMERNQGPGAARNRAIPLVRGRVVVFVGDDIIPSEGFLRGHVEAHRRRSDVGSAVLGHVAWAKDLTVNNLMLHIDGVGAEQFSYYYLQDGEEYDFRHLYTANISLKTAFLRAEPHWFEDRFIYAAFEDAELAYRLSKRGLRIFYEAGIQCAHYHYHNIYTFAQRQYRAGQMALVMLRMHPELSGLIRGKRWPLRYARWLMQALAWPAGAADESQLESLAFHLGNTFENQPHPLLDDLYLGVLGYFYGKGLLDGVRSPRGLAARLRAVYARAALAGVLLRFIEQSRSSGYALPEGAGEALAARLRKMYRLTV